MNKVFAPLSHCPLLCLRKASVLSAAFALLSANCLLAQLIPGSVGFAAKAESVAGDDTPRGVEAVPAVTPLPSLAQPVFPPKPSMKDERLTRPEELYIEGDKYH